jgi:hypothetical protein
VDVNLPSVNHDQLQSVQLAVNCCAPELIRLILVQSSSVNATILVQKILSRKSLKTENARKLFAVQFKLPKRLLLLKEPPLQALPPNRQLPNKLPLLSHHNALAKAIYQSVKLLPKLVKLLSASKIKNPTLVLSTTFLVHRNVPRTPVNPMKL